MSTGQTRMDRYLAGIENEEEPQSPFGTESDAQRIVLRQFLNDIKSSSDRAPIVDLGSGKGVLAHEICTVWPDSEKPEYIAVDLLEPLRELQIPVELHNTSQKFEFGYFFEHKLATYSQKSTFVIRNVFHELDISETANLLFRLRSHLNQNSVIYVQDMVNLPVAERNHVGWEPGVIKELFQFSGFDFQHIPIMGRSGTLWYAGTMKANGSEVTEVQILKKCFELRSAQLSQMYAEIDRVSDYSVDGSYETYVRLSLEASALGRQLDAVATIASNEADAGFGTLEVPGIRIHLTTSTRVLGTSAIVAESAFSQVTGCVGALRDKDHIDFPKLFEQARVRLWFAGYSQHLLFQSEENRVALRDALLRNVDLRVLVLNPDSAMVRLAGSNRPADGEARLRQGILNTIEAADRARHSFSEAGRPWPLSNMRLVDSPFPGSYFFVDGNCFFSSYTSQTSGSRAPCLIYQSDAATLAGYFEILQDDFLAMWDRAVVVGTGGYGDASI